MVRLCKYTGVYGFYSLNVPPALMRALADRGCTRQLLQVALKPYAALTCVGVVTDNVTAEGCTFSERYGFTRVRASDHDSWIYEQSRESFVNNCGRQSTTPPPAGNN